MDSVSRRWPLKPLALESYVAYDRTSERMTRDLDTAEDSPIRKCENIGGDTVSTVCVEPVLHVEDERWPL